MIRKFFHYLFKNQLILVLFLVAVGWLILQLKDILALLFISYIIMAALLPAVVYLKKKGTPHLLSVVIPFLIVIIVTIIIIIPLITLVGDQIRLLVTGLPTYIDQAASVIGVHPNATEVQTIVSREFDNLGRNAFNLTQQVFGGVFSMLTVFVVSFYLTLSQDSFQKTLAKLFDTQDQDRIVQALNKVNEKLGAWLRGQFLLCLSIGLLSWIALTLLNVPYALPLAILAGLLEIIPTLGPIISAVPAVIVALTNSPTLGVTVILVYIVIQLLENNLLVPKIMQRAVGLNPIIVILSVMIGGNLMGVSGALLSIPFISFVIVLYNSLKTIEK